MVCEEGNNGSGSVVCATDVARIVAAVAGTVTVWAAVVPTAVVPMADTVVTIDVVTGTADIGVAVTAASEVGTGVSMMGLLLMLLLFKFVPPF